MNRLNRSFVRFMLILGSLLVLAALCTLIVKKLPTQVKPQGKDFQSIDSELVSWDGLSEPKAILQHLDEIQRSVINSGEALSLLKRYRTLAEGARTEVLKSQLTDLYNYVSTGLYKKFPERPELFTVVLDSFLQVPRLLTDSELELLKHIEPRFINAENAALLMLVLHKGRLADNPEHFSDLTYGPVLLKELQSSVPLPAYEVLALALSGNLQGALAEGNKLNGIPGKGPLILANLLYDFGSPEEAARLFHSLYESEGRLSYKLQEADSYLKAGKAQSARSIWESLYGDLSGSDVGLVLYNLGSMAETASDRRAYFTRLLDMERMHEYAILQYSRLLPAMDAISYLKQSPIFEQHALLQLETIRRQEVEQSTGPMVASLWFLLNRFPRDERLYHWAAWYLYRIGNTEELGRLLTMAQENHIENPALQLYKALIVMEQGRLSEAEALLASYTKTAWYIPANLAKIYERTYRITKAIEFYQLAASLAHNSLVESRLYEQVANCYVILGRESDARRSYEYALQLNPDNITAAFALQKLERNQK